MEAWIQLAHSVTVYNLVRVREKALLDSGRSPKAGSMFYSHLYLLPFSPVSGKINQQTFSCLNVG